MSTYLNRHSDHTQPFHTISQQRSLEIQNKQLQEQLKDRQYALTLQIKILTTHATNHNNLTYLSCIGELLSCQNEMRSFLTQKLIKKQLQIEEAKEMSQIIKNYEQRISDLRSVLINKQGEISAASYEFSREQITRRQNLQGINNETLQKMALARYAKQKKKLQVEIEALQFTFNQLRNGKQSKRKKELKFKEQTLKKQPVYNKNGQNQQFKNETQQFTVFSGSRQQDILTDKVVKMIEQETQKFNQQVELAELLKLELHTIEAQITPNLQKYTKAQQQWSKMFAKNQQPVLGQNKVQNQLSFIKELQQQMSHTNSDFNKSELFFSNRDTNIVLKQSEPIKSVKPQRCTFKQRRNPHLKQN